MPLPDYRTLNGEIPIESRRAVSVCALLPRAECMWVGDSMFRQGMQKFGHESGCPLQVHGSEVMVLLVHRWDRLHIGGRGLHAGRLLGLNELAST